MLILRHLLAQGRTRFIYQHPDSEQCLIKVMRPYSFGDADKARLYLRSVIRRLLPHRAAENTCELANYFKVRARLNGYLPEFYPHLVETDKGRGIVVEKIQDEDLSISVSLDTYIQAGSLIDAFLQRIIYEFFNDLIVKKVYFFDFNPRNFLLQRVSGTFRLFFIDLKSYEKDRAIMPLTCLHPRFSEAKMMRRIDRFYQKHMPVRSPDFDTHWI